MSLHYTHELHLRLIAEAVAAETERCAAMVDVEKKHWEMRAAAITGDSEPLKLSYEQDARCCEHVAAQIRSAVRSPAVSPRLRAYLAMEQVSTRYGWD